MRKPQNDFIIRRNRNTHRRSVVTATSSPVDRENEPQNGRSSSNIKNEKIPKSRSGLLWQPDILDAKFDYQTFLEKKQERDIAHQKKLS